MAAAFSSNTLPMAAIQPLVLSEQVQIWPPLIVAPMAGVSSAPFRMLNYKFGAGLCMSEMVIAHTLVDRNPTALHLARFHDREQIRSLQLYSTRPDRLADAALIAIEELGVTHIDLNFGCPVKKVTSKGGGAALGSRPALVYALVKAANRICSQYDVPLTVKIRTGIWRDKPAYIDVGLAAQDAGASAVTLHARAAEELYCTPGARWDDIAKLVERLTIPVIGNGDVMNSEDALKMMEQTKCKAVMIGRACLGRPWLIRETAHSMLRLPVPDTRESIALLSLLYHTHHLAVHESGPGAVLQMRKFVPLYLRHLPMSKTLQDTLLKAKDLSEWKHAFRDFVAEQKADGGAILPKVDSRPRLKGAPNQIQKIVVPDWMRDSRATCLRPGLSLDARKNEEKISSTDNSNTSSSSSRRSHLLTSSLDRNDSVSWRSLSAMEETFLQSDEVSSSAAVEG